MKSMLPNVSSHVDETSSISEDDDEVELVVDEKAEAEQVARLAKVLASKAAFGYIEEANEEKTPAIVPIYKPDCSGLDSAVEFDQMGIPAVFIPNVGDAILLEYTNHPWWSTARFEIEKIRENGDLLLWNRDRFQYSQTNWKNAYLSGIKIYFETAKKQVALTGLRQRGAKLRSKIKEEPIVNVKQGFITPQVEGSIEESDSSIVKKKRGRPKGSKNKSTLTMNNTKA